MWSWPSYLNLKYAKWKNSMDNKLDGQILIIQATIDDNRQESDEKMKTYDPKLDNLTATMENFMDQIQILK